MKKFLGIICMLVMASVTQAATYNFCGAQVDVDAWAGSGKNENILVVDWNGLDRPFNGPDIVSESHAFGYRWDGSATLLDMLTAFDNADIFEFQSPSWGSGIGGISYYDQQDNEQHNSMNAYFQIASTTDPNALWGHVHDNTEWDFNYDGTSKVLADGQFIGINAYVWTASQPGYAEDVLDIPMASPVPTPGAFSILAAGLLGLAGIKRKNS